MQLYGDLLGRTLHDDDEETSKKTSVTTQCISFLGTDEILVFFILPLNSKTNG